jgi:Tol biopolymer transport system component/DNA-binding SARP family transcriptional activator
MFRLRVLGGFALEGPAGPMPPLPQRRAEAVLAVLAVCGDLGCTRERLIALLWPESDEAHSRHSLRSALGAIRQVLGPDTVLSAGDHLRLDSAALASDAHAFSQARTSGRYADAVQAFGGPLLNGFHVDGAPEFERWLDCERARLAREYAEALTYLGTAAERTGASAEAASWWARAVEHDPLNSHLVLRQVEALAAMGDRANAIKLADAHARRLRQELDLEPDPEVLAKIERIRNGEIATPHEGAGHLSPAPSTGLPKPPSAPLRSPEEPTSPGVGAELERVTAASAVKRIGRQVPWDAVPAALAILALVAIHLSRSKPLQITASDIVQITDDPGVEFQPAISPDGNEVAYLAGPVDRLQLYVRSTGDPATGGVIRLGDTAVWKQWLPKWTADGQAIRFTNCIWTATRGCRVWQTGKFGGIVRTVATDKGRAAWSPDDARVAYVVADTIFTASTHDTTRHLVAAHRVGTEEPHSLAWSPDGRYIAYVNSNVGWQWSAKVAPSSIWIVSAEGGEPQRVTAENRLNVSPAWLDARHLLFISDRAGVRAVYVVEVGPRGARGEPRLVPGVSDPHSISYSIASRKLAWAKGNVRQNIWSYPLDSPATISVREGRPLTTGNQIIERHDVSPDGRWIAYDGNRRGNEDLYKLPLGGGEPVPLTESPQDEFAPRWSPDGREIAFYTGGPTRIPWVMPVEGSGRVRLTSGPYSASRPQWSPDGLRIVVLSGQLRPRVGAWLVSRDSVGGSWHDPVPLTDRFCWPLAWAPDGSGVLCTAEQKPALFFVSVTGQVLWSRDLPGLAGFMEARYSRDGSTLYAVDIARDSRYGVWAIADGGRGAARLAIAFDDPALMGMEFLSAGPDRLYLTVAEYESDIWVATLQY